MKKRTRRWSEQHFNELGLGRFGEPFLHRVHHERREWCEPCTSGFTCSSFFESDAQRERCYWDVRDELFAEVNWPDSHGIRPYGYWLYEAPLVCDHDPRCPTPAGDAAVDRWLDEHEQLSPRERRELLTPAPRLSAGDGAIDDDADVSAPLELEEPADA